MGEVVPGECMANALSGGDHLRTLSSLEYLRRHAWDTLKEVLAVEHAEEASVPMMELLWEEGGEGV